MNSDALVVAVATGIAACAMLVGLAFASWLAGRSRTGAAEPVAPAARLPPSVADGVAPKQLPVLAQELSAHAYSAAAQAARAKAALAAARAALDACRRGEMSAEALRRVFGHADPSPEREQREREADRLALTESHARRAFQQAVAAARVAREELHVVEVAEAAVRQEAADAALEAQDAAIAVRARRRRR